jgi:hypothetical protein
MAQGLHVPEHQVSLDSASEPLLYMDPEDHHNMAHNTRHPLHLGWVGRNEWDPAVKVGVLAHFMAIN